MYKKIGDYGVIGNLQTVALVGKDGAIDWFCLPHIDSPSVFGALLDADDGGTFSVTPEGEWDSVLYYLQDSNVLSGRYRTRNGTYTLTDFLTVTGPSEDNPHEFLLIRLLHVERGTVRVRVTFDPRFDYGRASTACFLKGPDRVVARGGPESLTLCCSRSLELKESHAEGVWELEEGERVALRLYYGEGDDAPLSDLEAERLVVQTLDFWRGWLYRSGTGFFNDLGPHREQVVRSLLALKLPLLRPARNHGGGSHHLPSRGDRRGAQLGLPFLVGARHVHGALSFVPGGARQGGGELPGAAPAGDRRERAQRTPGDVPHGRGIGAGGERAPSPGGVPGLPSSLHPRDTISRRISSRVFSHCSRSQW